MTIRHEDIPGVMPAMTMAFRCSPAVALAGITAGARVRFELAREGAELVIVGMRPAGQDDPRARSRAPSANCQHDHTPHHGGVVAMYGQLHVETVARADGRVYVYLTDFCRVPLPLTGTTGSVTLALPGGRRVLDLAAREGVLEASGPPLGGDEVRARVAIDRPGTRVAMDVVLPLARTTGGASGIPLAGCVPVAAGAPAPRPRCTLEFPRPVTALAASVDGTVAFAAVVDHGVSAWRLPAGEFAHGFAAAPAMAMPAGEQPHPEAANAVIAAPHTTEVVVALEARLLRYEGPTGRLLGEVPGPGGVVRAVTWAPDGSSLGVTAFYDDAAHVIRIGDGRELHRLPVGAEAAALAFAAGGTELAVGSEAGAIMLFSLERHGVTRTLSGGARAVRALAFAGDRLVGASDDGVVRIWDRHSARPRHELSLGSSLLQLAASADGRRVASGGRDGVVHLLDVEGGARLATLAWHQSQILALAWAGNVLLTADGQGQVALWDLPAAQG